MKDLIHFPTRRQLPPDSEIYPEKPSHHPHPQAEPLGTFGRNRRLVYQRQDMHEAHSKTAWRQQGFEVIDSEKPLRVKIGHYGTFKYGIYGPWQVTPLTKRH